MSGIRRILKQAFIAIIYLVFFSGLGIGIYFLFRPAPAPPPPPPPPTIYSIETILSQTFVSGINLYSVVAKIKNPNTNFGASSFDYVFYLYDDNNIFIKTLTNKSFIWPGESKYIIESGINLTKAPVKAILEVKNPIWHEVHSFNGINLTLENVNYRKGTPGSGKFFMVNFTANNGTPFDLKEVYISAVIFNKAGLPITAGSTILENLKSKERRSFSIPWFSEFSGVPNSVDLSISTNLWETPALLSQ